MLRCLASQTSVLPARCRRQTLASCPCISSHGRALRMIPRSTSGSLGVGSSGRDGNSGGLNPIGGGQNGSAVPPGQQGPSKGQDGEGGVLSSMLSFLMLMPIVKHWIIPHWADLVSNTDLVSLAIVGIIAFVCHIWAWLLKLRFHGEGAQAATLVDKVNGLCIELRADMQALRTEVRTNIQALRADVQVLRNDVQAIKASQDRLERQVQRNMDTMQQQQQQYLQGQQLVQQQQLLQQQLQLSALMGADTQVTGQGPGASQAAPPPP